MIGRKRKEKRETEIRNDCYAGYQPEKWYYSQILQPLEPKEAIVAEGEHVPA